MLHSPGRVTSEIRSGESATNTESEWSSEPIVEESQQSIFARQADPWAARSGSEPMYSCTLPKAINLPNQRGGA